MFAEDYVYYLPVWALVALAMIPPMIVIIGMRLRPRPTIDNRATMSLRGSVQGLLSTAFVFSVTFSVGQMWSQNMQIHDRAFDLAIEGRDVVMTVERVDPSLVDEVADRYTTFLLAAADVDSLDVALAGSTEAREALLDLESWIDSQSSLAEVREDIDSDLDDVYEARSSWIKALYAPGIPDVVWINIVVLGLIFAGVIGSQPPGRYPRYEFRFLLLGGIVIGFFQIPLYILNSQVFVTSLANTVFREFTGRQLSTLGLIEGVMSFVVVTTAFLVIMLLLRRYRPVAAEDRTDQEDTPTGSTPTSAQASGS